MHSISSKYRKPKSRPSKRNQAASDKASKRWSNVTKLCPDTSDSAPQSHLTVTMDKNDCVASTSGLKLQAYTEITPGNPSSSNNLPNYYVAYFAWKNKIYSLNDVFSN
jgi:hypothetical protein